MGNSLSYRWLLAGIPLFFLGVFFFYPLARILVFSFLPGAVGQTAGIWDVLSSGLVAKTLWFTCWQAAASTVLTLLLGLPGAYVFARFSFAGKRLLSALTTIPFVLPTVVTASAFRALLGPRGLVNTFCVDALGFDSAPVQIDQTVWFFLLAHVFYNTTLVLRMVGGFWSNLDPRLAEAAGMLGAGRWTVFRRVTLPLLGPVIWSSALLVFTFCFTSFGVILILGGPGYATIEVEIYRQAVQLFNLPVAATLSLLQIAFSFCLLWCYTWLSRRTSIAMHTDSAVRTQRPPRTLSQRLLVWGTLVFLILLLGSPLAALVVRSFTTESGLSPAYYLALFHQQGRSVFFVPPITAVANSVGFACAAMLMAVLLGGLAAYYLASPKANGGTLLDALLMTPLAVSAVTLGFGYIITLNRPPLNLRDSLALIPLAHTVVAFPFVIRCLLPSLRRIPGELRQAAAMLGASPVRVWLRVDLPLAGRAVLAAAVFAFSVSMGEFGASSFVARPHTPTLPVAIYRFLGQPGSLNYGQAMAMSVVLMLVTGAGFLLLEKLRTGMTGDF